MPSRSGVPEEEQHFESVLSRLDALLRRDHVAAGLPGNSSVDAISPISEEDTVPVLTEVYEGQVPALKLDGCEAGSISAMSAMHPDKRSGLPDTHVQPDAYFGSLAMQSAISWAGEHRSGEAPIDIDAIAEKLVAGLTPQIQEAVTRAIEEETERILAQVQPRVEVHMRDEIEPILRERLRHLLAELGLNRNKTGGS